MQENVCYLHLELSIHKIPHEIVVVDDGRDLTVHTQFYAKYAQMYRNASLYKTRASMVLGAL